MGEEAERHKSVANGSIKRNSVNGRSNLKTKEIRPTSIKPKQMLPKKMCLKSAPAAIDWVTPGRSVSQKLKMTDRHWVADVPPCLPPPKKISGKPGEHAISNDRSQEVTKIKHLAMIVGAIEPDINNYIEMPTVIGGIHINSMADTRALLSAAMSERVAIAQQLKIEPYSVKTGLEGANGFRLHMLGVTIQATSVRLGNSTEILNVEYHVIRNSPVDVLIGKKTLGRLRISIHCDTNGDS